MKKTLFPIVLVCVACMLVSCGAKNTKVPAFPKTASFPQMGKPVGYVINTTGGSKGVFYNNQAIAGADLATFTTLNTYYAKDKKNIYAGNIKLESVDATTFRALNANYAKDANAVYIWRTKLVGADSATFDILNTNYAKDANAVYHLS